MPQPSFEEIERTINLKILKLKADQSNLVFYYRDDHKFKYHSMDNTYDIFSAFSFHVTQNILLSCCNLFGIVDIHVQHARAHVRAHILIHTHVTIFN